MSRPKELNAIKSSSLNLWYKVNEKYGDHKYTLCVNGLGEVELCKGYCETIAKGTREINAKLRELLEEVK